MALSRYAIPDTYTLEELSRDYQASDAKGRIGLLHKLYEGNSVPPYEIALLAVVDPHVEVRQWFARHGKPLDYKKIGPFNRRSIVLETVKGILQAITSESSADETNLNLANRLKNDPDPFVRACLRENPTVFEGWGGEWIEYFREATHMERLALMRNPEVRWGEKLVVRIFDYEDRELGVDLEERKELVLAFLSNEEALGVCETAELQPSGSRDFGVLKRLWELASRWPKETGILFAVYGSLPADDKTKAQTYQRCDEPVLRREILRNCNAEDTETIGLGMNDPDERCRDMAARVQENIKKSPKTRGPQNPEELFNEKGASLEDKVDFLGRKLLSFEEQVRSIIKALYILAAIWIGWRLFVWLFG